MTDEQLERALDVTCPQCGADSGMECVTTSNVPLSDVTGIPVHDLRGME